MVKVPKVATGIRLPEPIMQVIDAAAARWLCDRGQAMTRIVQEWNELKVRQLPLASIMSQPESEAEQMRRLKVQELPGFIPNNLEVNMPSPNPSQREGDKRGEEDYLGTGPGDEVGE